jgi:glycosyltransferase involved in cell wall biosynthesis
VTRHAHQLLAALSYGDAIGNEALAIQAHLRRAGFDSEIYAEAVHPRMAGWARPLWEYSRVSGPDTLCLYHFSIGSAAGRLIHHSSDRLVCIYHNITPAEHFLGFHSHLAGLCYHGRRELEAFAPRAELALADSEFNRRDLLTAGFRRTGVLPIVLDLAAYGGTPSPVVRRLYDDGRTNILFVGRIAPNKRIEHLIKTVFYFKKFVSPLVRLILVGKTATFPRYYEACARMADEFYLAPEEIRFLGHVPDAELFALYRASDVFLSLSEHEGFCLPLIESMIFDLPVVALASTAVPGTLGEAGILMDRWRPDETAELLALAAGEAAVRERMIAAGRRELARFKAFPRERVLLDALRECL